MTAHHRWLRQEVARWQADGLVDAALAQRLLARYPATEERGWGRIVFSAIGAVLVGLGVILFFAYNWDELPKAAKLALVFAALFAAHGSAMMVARGAQPNRGVVEGLHALGTMLFGAGIWLVAQIYHIDEHYPNAFLVWSLGAVALAWAMPSVVQGMLALFLVAFWAGIEAFQFRTPMHGAPLLVAAGVLPLAWWRRSPALLFCGLAVFLVVTAFAMVSVELRGLVPLLFIFAVAAFVAGSAAPLTAFPAAEGPLRSLGLVVAIVCGYALTFPGLARELGRVPFDKPALVVYFSVAAAALVGALTGAGALVAQRGWAQVAPYRRWQLALLAAALLLVLASMFLRKQVDGWVLALPFNVIVLALATVLILEGSARLQPWRVGGGCLVFALVTVSRYTDLFGSLLARAVVFVALGAGLFLVGNFYARQRRQAQAERA